MEKNKILALIFAILAALLVMWAGKSCAEDIASRRTGGNGKEPSVGFNYTNSGGAVVKDNGNLNDAQIAGSTGEAPDLNDADKSGEEQIEYVTDMLGRVEATIIKETQPDAAPADTQTTTAEKSILDQYNESQNSGADPISGFNHGSGGNSGSSDSSEVKEGPTLPKDFAIVLN